MIDADNLRYPVFDEIIATCKRNPSVEEYKNIENNMNTIQVINRLIHRQQGDC